jgi:hypothetical protein
MVLFITTASLGGYIAVVLECGQCLVFYGDLMDDGSVVAKGVHNGPLDKATEVGGLVYQILLDVNVKCLVVVKPSW